VMCMFVCVYLSVIYVYFCVWISSIGAQISEPRDPPLTGVQGVALKTALLLQRDYSFFE